MKIIEVGSEYFRRGHENAKRVYVVRVGGVSYDVVAASQEGAKASAEARYAEEFSCMPGRGPRAEGCHVKVVK